MNDTNINKSMKSLNCSTEFNRGVQVGANASCSLNRKRPNKLDIPSALRQIGGNNDASCFSVPGVGVYSIRGMKTFMEDAYKVVSFPQEHKGFFGVYDGHGGSVAADYVAEHLYTNINKMLENCSLNGAKEAIKAGYLKTDQDFLKQGIIGGACCVSVLIDGKQIWVSNVGDSRAVLCRGEIVESLTKDHIAGDVDERRRIQDNGGYVEMCGGVWRVDGVLGVSRSIGDAYLKDWMLAEPETKSLHLTSDMEYVVLASGGLWKEVSNEEILNIVKRSCSNKNRGPEMQQAPRGGNLHIKEKADSNGLVDACKELTNLAVMRGSLDDITVIIVDLYAFK